MDPGVNLDFKENSPFEEGVISEACHGPNKSFFQESQELNSLVYTSNLVKKFLPKQANIDSLSKEIQAGYLSSPYFTDIYLYLAPNKLCSTKAAIRKVETLAE